MSPAPDDRYRLDHVAFAVPEVAAATPFLVGTLGGRPFGAGPGHEFRWWQWEFSRGGALEVLQPDGPPGGFVHRFLASRGPGVHHVTFKVPELASAADRARSFGYDVVGYDDRSPWWKECFLHPKQAQGIVVQLAESNPELDPDDVPQFEFPQSPPPAPACADVVGVRLRASSEADARRQWESLLQGRCEPDGAVLRFRWDDSPLGVAVEIDPSGPVGPVAIEVHAGVELPSGPHPVLGIAFEEHASGA